MEVRRDLRAVELRVEMPAYLAIEDSLLGKPTHLSHRTSIEGGVQLKGAKSRVLRMGFGQVFGDYATVHESRLPDVASKIRGYMWGYVRH